MVTLLFTRVFTRRQTTGCSERGAGGMVCFQGARVLDAAPVLSNVKLEMVEARSGVEGSRSNADLTVWAASLRMGKGYQALNRAGRAVQTKIDSGMAQSITLESVAKLR